MATAIDLSTFVDHRGRLTVIEGLVPGGIRRVFYIYGVDDSVRGRHRHKETTQLAVALQGRCEIHNVSGPGQLVERFLLDSPEKAILIHPSDFHWMQGFSPDCILMVLASKEFDPDDYIYEPY